MAAFDWATFLGDCILALASLAALIVGLLNRRSLTTPSGDKIGHVVERTHDLAAVTTMALTNTTARPGLDRSVERLNDDPNGPVTINGLTEEP